MDEVGYGGAPVNDRRFANEQLATVFEGRKAEVAADESPLVGDGQWRSQFIT